MTRLDALKARVAAEGQQPGHPTWAKDPYITLHCEDIERLMAVVEAAQALLKVPLGENSLYDFKEDRLRDALAYWLEEEQR